MLTFFVFGIHKWILQNNLETPSKNSKVVLFKYKGIENDIIILEHPNSKG